VQNASLTFLKSDFQNVRVLSLDSQGVVNDFSDIYLSSVDVTGDLIEHPFISMKTGKFEFISCVVSESFSVTATNGSFDFIGSLFNVDGTLASVAPTLSFDGTRFSSGQNRSDFTNAFAAFS
jgi:hypothetical protein